MTYDQMLIGAWIWVGIGIFFQVWNMCVAYREWPHSLTIVASFVPIPGTVIFYRTALCLIPHGLALFILHTIKEVSQR
jgi:hypothetical protein